MLLISISSLLQLDSRTLERDLHVYFRLCLRIICIVYACVHSIWTLEDEIVRGYPCVRRSKQIYCPLPGSPLSNIYMATANSSVKQGPRMYARHFSVNDGTRSTTISTTTSSTTSGLKSHVIYYTKQFDEGGQNAFDLNDEEEHRFMHGENADENVIDDGKHMRRVKRHRINSFIDENKALVRRMFGTQGDLDSDMIYQDTLEHYASFHDGPGGALRRVKRTLRPTPVSVNKVDSCESTTEIVTPYWASNSAGKIRAIVNTQHLQQAIQQEVCKAVQTKRCNDDCSCEQKYKWHRLLAYDPDDDCKGIFMDWFLFPSCCVCRCVKL